MYEYIFYVLVGFEKFVDTMMTIASDWCQGNALGPPLYKVDGLKGLYVGLAQPQKVKGSWPLKYIYIFILSIWYKYKL